MHEKSLFNDGWGSFDPSDFEGSFKKKVLDAETSAHASGPEKCR
jgi:hypothetical protein